jgi:transposase-like protein
MGISKAAYQGKLTCPVCHSEAIRFVENLGPYRKRYRCRKCGLPFQYEMGDNIGIHPYAPFTRTKFQEVIGVKTTDVLDAYGRKIIKENHNG